MNRPPIRYSWFCLGFMSVQWEGFIFSSRYKSRERDATMSILDIGLLTGFTVNENDLNLVRSNNEL